MNAQPDERIQAVDEDGHRYYTLVDCWRPPKGGMGGVERCYDYSSRDFPSPSQEEEMSSSDRHRDGDNGATEV